ncbi:MAG TPA: hypothetical protein VJS92_01180 [Candidatus Polarisedimenticolaceae bacterium]|nr:hypothetical protein [Candidatus Polarisedimenticolaceae bacterium]
MTQQQSDRLKEAQDIANETTKFYGVPRVSVFRYESLSPEVAGGYAAHQRWILLRQSTLDDTAFLPVLTHELGHVTLGHEYDVVVGGGGRTPTMAAYWRARQQRELDANARAIEIMVRVLNKTEPEAVTLIANYLVAANTARDGRAIALPRAHLHPCDQLMDLVIRFPGEWTRDAKCEKASDDLPVFPYRGTDQDLGLRAPRTAPRQP